MTRPPPPRRHTGLALWACAGLGVTALGFLVGHGNTSAAAVRAVMPLSVAPTTTPDPLYAPVSVPSPATVTLYRSGAAESTRTITRPSRTITAASTRTVFGTRTATATVTAVQTVTATATQTVTVTTTAAPPAPTAGSAQ